MKKYNRYFLIDNFEEGWDLDIFYGDELASEYCIEVLYIPQEKIDELAMQSHGLEIYLTDLSKHDLTEDWYTNLTKMALDISDI